MNSAKAYLVYVGGKTAGESYLLADVTREDLFGVPCIKGMYRHPTSPTHWLSSRTIFVPLANVQMVVEYDSPEAYKDAVKEFYQAQAKQS